jgi:GT2 family glycosyltransferase
MNTALSVIIVNWNGRTLLERCLAALYTAIGATDQIIVVDNGSHDDSVAWVQLHYPDITLVTLPSNLGFAGGNNAALAHCQHEWMLLINNDAFVAPDAIDILKATAVQAAPNVGAISATLLFDHAPTYVASAGIMMRQDGVALDRDMATPVANLPAHPYPVMGASGGAVLLRRAMIDDIGFFAADFFNYLEDVDLALRALLRGWHTVHCPGAHIRHIYSATSGQGSPFKQRLLGRNRWRTLIRCLPTTLWWRHWHHIIGYDVIACIGLALTGGWSGIAGRFSLLGEWHLLREQRRHIQHGRTATADDVIAHWLVRAPWPWQSYAEIARLNALIHQRPSTRESA